MNIESIRREFLSLTRTKNDAPLVYFDSAATTLKPQRVVEVLTQFYNFEAANVHRGAHFLSDEATTKYEQSRHTVAQFLGGAQDNEVVFTRGTTESINLIAQSYGRAFLKKGDVVLLSEMEHHSNLVPWHLLAEEKELELRYIPVGDQGELDLGDLSNLLKGVKLVSFVYCSNTLGTVNPVKKVIDAAHAVGAKVVVDAAQAMTGLEINVKEMDCDFLCFSGHKAFAPFGIGVLYGKEELLNSMPPYQGGGSMIVDVNKCSSTYLDSPQRFEAGTPNVGGAVALKVACDFITELGIQSIYEHEKELTDHCKQKLKELGGVKSIGNSETQFSLVSFFIDGVHPADVGHILNEKGVAIRTGHHCTQLLMQRYNVPSTIRASFSVYNTLEEVDYFVEALGKAKDMLL